MKKALALLLLLSSLQLWGWEREAIWPKNKMPDAQGQQIAAMTDEANGMVCAVAELDEDPSLNSDGAEGIECFQNYYLIGRDEALDMIKSCRDRDGAFFSVYTWCALVYFASGAWEEAR